ncbi:fasciclin domain-containing protein [Streptomyces zingiberis]|uniref:Fasciclin domain-containing protein n=1 Tax=Streptomyces zingiberis TaxID=2053010 RepID=A0ABX1BQ14_9ACTN|nr:fasciclin domain-containing protein [Streptomyces zingiberis]NJP99137.1 fasciclin domain-containing protein [Streptomyces zingiberis]
MNTKSQRTLRLRRAAIAVTTAAVLPLSLAACSSDDGGDSSSKGTSAAEETQAEETPAEEAEGSDDMAGMAEFGPACSAVPKDGAGSFDGMAKDPVATAASNNPELSTLVTAVKKAGLVDTLNSAEDITVFAPTNDAFDKIPEADLEKVLNDKEQLTKILTYHVTGEKLTPEDLGDGTFTTLEKGDITTSGSGESYTVNDEAKVVCGNVKTANANVYIIDSVLMPKS